MPTTKQRILEASAVIFAQRGPEATIHEIARVAKVNEVTVFRLFQNKESLFRATLEFKMRESVLPRIRTTEKACFLFTEYMRQHHEYIRLLLITMLFYPQYSPLVEKRWRYILKQVGGAFNTENEAIAVMSCCFGLYIYEGLFKLKIDSTAALTILLRKVDK